MADTSKQGSSRAKPGRTQKTYRPPSAGENRQPPAPKTASKVTIRTAPSDQLVATLVAAGAALLFLTTFSNAVSMGDAPESVAGVKTLSVLHAPGYPGYVLAARLFTLLDPLGEWTTRVNLFSVVCAAATIGLVYLVARRIGASPTGSVIGAFTLGTTASFWFNAGFAKHYAFSGMLVVAAMYFVLTWEHSGSRMLLVAGGACLGVCTGASWQLAAITALGLLVVILFGARKPGVAEAVAAGAIFVCVGVALVAFLVVRAGQDPAINWGDAHTAGRLFDVITQKDFRLGSASTPNGTSVLSRIGPRTGVYFGLIARDVGFGGILLALFGAIAMFWRSTRAHIGLLVVIALANFVAVIVAVGLEVLDGFNSALIAGGFLVALFVALALLVALGASELVDLAADWVRSNTDKARRFGMTTRRAYTGVVALIVAAVLLPSAITHFRHADHHTPSLVDQYAERVLTALPPNAVLVVGGYGYGLPILYRQIVFHQRPDVTFVDGGMTTSQWYLDQITRRTHFGETVHPGDGYDALLHLVSKWRSTRPVYLDTSGMAALRDALGYRAEGLVGAVVDGLRAHPGQNLDATAADLDKADVADHVASQANNRFPMSPLYLLHERAHIELAKQYFFDHNMPGVIRELDAAGRLYPSDPALPIVFAQIAKNDPRLPETIKQL